LRARITKNSWSQKRRLRGDLIAVCSFFEGSSSGGGADLLSLVTSNGT